MSVVIAVDSGLSDSARLAKNAAISETRMATRQRRKDQACRVFTLKIQSNRLSKRQKTALKMMFVEAKWLRNSVIASENIFGYEISATVDVLNKDRVSEQRDFTYLGSQIRQSVLAQVQSDVRSLAARKGKGKGKGGRVGRLKYCSEVVSLDLKQAGVTYRRKSETKYKLQRVPGVVRVGGGHQLVGWELANAKLLSKPDGYYIAVTAFKNNGLISAEYQSGTVIGIDFGVKTHLTLSNGAEIDGLVGETERLKSLQQKFARQEKGSNNRYKTLCLLKIEYQKMSNRKNDLANKVVHDLLKNEFVFMQDEQIKGWRSKSGFARGGKRLQHAILGRVKAKLVKHPRVVVLSKTEPTTQSCPCGARNKHDLSQRTYSCPCGYSMQRDVHAAQNMIRLGSKILPVGRRLELVERESDWKSLDYQLRAAKQETGRSSVVG